VTRRCRVLDLGIITAGAATSAILADLGCEVIKIESPTYRDPFRTWSGDLLPGEDPSMPPFFRMTNRGKVNAAIDLKHPRGRAAFLRLVAKSDVVVENFSRGVLERLGLGYADLRDANPDIILASISSQGDTGPDAGYVSFGSTLEAMAGLAALTGYEDGGPVVSGIELNYPDQVVAVFAASMVMTAWHARLGGAGGAHLDISQRDLTSFLCGEAFAAPDQARRRGNGQDGFALQDSVACADGRWIAASVLPERAPGAARLFGGLTIRDFARWAGERAASVALSALHAEGIEAAEVLTGDAVLAGMGKDWTRAVRPTAAGDLAKGILFDGGPAGPAAPAPTAFFGADTRAVLRRIGGFSEAEIADLLAAGAVAVHSEAAPHAAAS
jgi:crotonobetainyl-CoA:carnitine CoA-transferase CaiB-like acyl-CoA transferase